MTVRLLTVVTIFSMAALTLLMRTALETWPLGLAGLFSRIVALAVLWLWILTTGRGWRYLRPNGAGRWLAVMCSFSVLINFGVFYALEWTTPTNHAILYRLDTVFVVLLGGLLGLEQIQWKELMLLPVMLVGMALVAEIGRSGFQVHWVGDLIVVAAAVGFAVNAFVNRQIVRKMEPQAMAVYNVVSGSVGFILVSFLDSEWQWLAQNRPSLPAWLVLVALGSIIAGFVPAYYAMLRHIPVWKLRTWMLIVPLLVAVADWGLWGARLTPSQMLGAGLLLGGLVLLIQFERQDRPVALMEFGKELQEDTA